MHDYSRRVDNFGLSYITENSLALALDKLLLGLILGLGYQLHSIHSDADQTHLQKWAEDVRKLLEYFPREF